MTPKSKTPIAQRAKNLVAKKIASVRKKRLIASGGAPAEWYDDVYSTEPDEYVNHYSESRYLPVWEAICERVPAGAGVLEAGCGPAQLAEMMIDRGVIRNYIGFDFSPAAIVLAKKHLLEQRLEVADAYTTDLFTTVDYDVIVCTEVLEHITDDLGIVERFPKGKQVLATVPNFDYETHVRFFEDADEVRERYGHLFDRLEVTNHFHQGDPDGSHGIFFLINGVR